MIGKVRLDMSDTLGMRDPEWKLDSGWLAATSLSLSCPADDEHSAA
jgi:hypothetical protein